MSLEDALKANTAAVEAHTAVLHKMLAGAKPAAAGAAPAKPAAAPAKPAAAPAKPVSKPAAKKKAETTEEHMTERAKAYLKGGSEDERAERKANFKAIIDYYGADRFTGIDPASFDEALGFLTAFENGEDPFAEEGEADEEGTDDSDI